MCGFTGSYFQIVQRWELQTNDALSCFHNCGQVHVLSGRTAGISLCNVVCDDVFTCVSVELKHQRCVQLSLF